MKIRIKAILKELKEVCLDEYLSVSHNVLFQEVMSCYRSEQIQKNREEYYKKDNLKLKEPATDKQIAYAQQLADNKNIDLKITGKETKEQISKLIEELKNVPLKDKNPKQVEEVI